MTGNPEPLRYRGDLTGSIHPGQLFGSDQAGRPYEVRTVTYRPVWCGTAHAGGDPCPGNHGHTTVHVQYATPDTLRAFFAGTMTAGGAS